MGNTVIYIYLDFEVVVFKLQSMRGLGTRAANTASSAE